MFGVLNVLLMGGFLLCGVLGEEFSVSLKEQIEAVSGSCVTIPCTFTVRDDLKNNLNSGCRALWTDEKDENKVFTGQTEDLTQKSCTTTLYNINEQQHHGTFYFRLDCGKPLRYSFKIATVNINIKGAPPALTLTPPTLSVTEGESVSVQCSAPVPCLSLPPTLTWSPVLGDVQETQQQQQDETFVKVSTLNFTASHSHHEKDLTCSAVYSRKDVTSVLLLRAQLKIKLKFAPMILNSSNCTGDWSQMSCLCETEGNPSPLIQWYFPGVSATNISITSEAQSDTSVRSIITVKDAQSKDPVTLICHSSNSLGSDAQTFTFSTLDKRQGGVLTSVMMVSVAVLVLLVLVLLFVIRSLVVRLRKLPSSPEAREQQVENTDAAGSAACSSQDDALYSNVTWMTKSDPSCSSYLEEQRSTVGDGRNSIIHKEAECEYAQVKFKPKQKN